MGTHIAKAKESHIGARFTNQPAEVAYVQIQEYLGEQDGSSSVLQAQDATQTDAFVASLSTDAHLHYSSRRVAPLEKFEGMPDKHQMTTSVCSDHFGHRGTRLACRSALKCSLRRCPGNLVFHHQDSQTQRANEHVADEEKKPL